MKFTLQDTQSKETFLLAKKRNVLKNPYKLFLTKQKLKLIDISLQQIFQELSQQQQIKVQSLDFTLNNSPLIPKILITANFTNLRYLYLHKTEISSIEFLSGINTERFKILILDQNHIINLKPLAKVLSKNVTILSLKKNPTLQTNHLSRVSLSQRFELSYLINKSFTSVYQQFPKIMSLNFQNVCSSIREVENSNDLIQNYGLKIIKKFKSQVQKI